MLVAYLDRLLAAVAPQWALRCDRARRQRALEADYDGQAVRWIDGEPWVRGADGMSWIRPPGSRRVTPPAALGPGWRPSTFWPRRHEPDLDPAARFRHP
jgi:hypothetical protein